MNIIKSHINNDQYYGTETKKSVIVLHHTAGGSNPLNVLHGWNYDPVRVATSYVIAGKEDSTKSYKEGDVIEAFEPKYWAYHLGLKTSNNEVLNQKSIGIEICNWGQLTKKADGKYYNYVNQVVPDNEVESFSTPYRGFLYYHKYSDYQINSLRDLLKYLIPLFNIDKTFHPEMFDVSQRALNGDSGVWTHTSYRTDKCDCSPQKNLLTMLTSL